MTQSWRLFMVSIKRHNITNERDPSRKSEDNLKNKTKTKEFVITIINDRCKGCKLCVSYCPMGTLKISNTVNHKGFFIPEVIRVSTCKGCNQCSRMCPDFAIFSEEVLGPKLKKE